MVEDKKVSILIDWCAASWSKNTAAWLFAGLFVFSLFSHYDTERELSDVCERILNFRNSRVVSETTKAYGHAVSTNHFDHVVEKCDTRLAEPYED